MSGSISISGFMSNPNDLRGFTEAAHRKIFATVRDKFKERAPELKAAAEAGVAAAFRVQKKAFPKAWHSHVWASRPERLPAISITNKIFWMGAQEYGATIKGRRGILIPFGKRLNLYAFRRLVQDLFYGKLAFFRKVGNRVVLFARPVVTSKLGNRRIGQFKREHAASLGVKRARLQDGPVPIATWLPAVVLRPRFSLERSITPALVQIARELDGVLEF